MYRSSVSVLSTFLSASSFTSPTTSSTTVSRGGDIVGKSGENGKYHVDRPILDTPVMSSAVPAEPSPAQKITAYYSLVFPTFTFYIQTLSVTIGRRCSSSANAPSSSTDTSPVDVDLGALKSVSRLHAKIEYDSEDDRFVLAVIGRNGAWVDGVWSGSGSRAPLGER